MPRKRIDNKGKMIAPTVDKVPPVLGDVQNLHIKFDERGLWLDMQDYRVLLDNTQLPKLATEILRHIVMITDDVSEIVGLLKGIIDEVEKFKLTQGDNNEDNNR